MWGFVLNVASALGFDFVNGFHDAPNATAAVVGTKTLSRRQAVAWNVLWTFVPFFLISGGLMTTGVAKTVGQGLISLSSLTPGVITTGLTAATCWGLITWRMKIPSSSTYALIGGLLGAAGMNSVLAAGSLNPLTILQAFFQPAIWPGLLGVGAAMVIVPTLAFACARATVRIIERRRENRLARSIIPRPRHTPQFVKSLNESAVRLFAAVDLGLQQIGKNFSRSQKSVSSESGGSTEVLAVITETPVLVGTQASQEQCFKGTREQWTQLAASACLSFAHASNDALKTAGILTMAQYVNGYNHNLAIGMGVVAVSFTTMALGTAFGGGRIEETLSKGLGKMDHPHGIVAQFTAAGAVMVATLTHWPISTTFALTGATKGVNGQPQSEHKKMANGIFQAWAWTMAATPAIGAILIGVSTSAIGHEWRSAATLAAPITISLAAQTGHLPDRPPPVPSETKSFPPTITFQAAI